MPSIIEAQIEVFRLCVRVNRLRYEIVRDYRMTPNFKGLAGALNKMKHDLEIQAAEMLSDIEATSESASGAFRQAKAKIAETKTSVADIKAFVAEMEGGNGGPTLADSSIASDQSQAAQPEHLTVNGVSAP